MARVADDGRSKVGFSLYEDRQNGGKASWQAKVCKAFGKCVRGERQHSVRKKAVHSLHPLYIALFAVRQQTHFFTAYSLYCFSSPALRPLASFFSFILLLLFTILPLFSVDSSCQTCNSFEDALLLKNVAVDAERLITCQRIVQCTLNSVQFTVRFTGNLVSQKRFFLVHDKTQIKCVFAFDAIDNKWNKQNTKFSSN